jgi:hypothetical protein
MNLLIVKLYQSYKRKGDPNPEMKVTTYLTLVLYFVTWCIALPAIEIISLRFYDDNLKIDRTVLTVGTLLICYLYYKQAFKYLFYKNKMKTLGEKYKSTHVPTPLLYLIVILIPVFLMLLGPTLAVMLTGGEIFGNRITGLLE